MGTGGALDRDELLSEEPLKSCCVFCSAVSFSLLSLSPSAHLKFSLCVSSKRDSLCDMICKHHPSPTQEDLADWYMSSTGQEGRLCYCTKMC